LNNKPKVLFVGAFNQTKDGSLGGQLFACKTLLSSPIKSELNFILIDSTMRTLPPPSLFIRAFYALKRLVKFLLILLRDKVSTVLIFTSSGFSFIEKGFMVIIAKIFCKKVIICPRSGFIIDDISRSSFMKYFVRKILSWSDFVVCQSQYWKSFYSNLTKTPLERFVVIHNWVDLSEYDLHIPNADKKINVLFMGWIEKNKGIYELVEAVNNNKKEMSHFNFVICGEGSESRKVRELVTKYQLGSLFTFKGWVSGDEKTNVLKSSHIFVMPSYREGLPNSLLEAMASGCAVIASAVGSITDVIKNHENGLLIESGDHKGLAQSIMLLGKDLYKRKKLILNARDTVENHHDINVSWKHFFEILDKV
jgi:glycosyltransferase involved in cell wall biosynthesis